MAEAVGCAGEFLGDTRVHRRIVAVIGRNCVRAEQVRQEFRIGNVLDFRRDNCPGLLVEMVAAPGRMLLVQLVDLVVVLTHEQSLQRGQRRVFLRPYVSGEKCAVVDWQIVAVRRLHVTVGEAKAVAGGLIRTIDHRGVEPTGDGIDRSRRCAVVPSRRIDDGAGHRDDRAVRKNRISRRHGYVDMRRTVAQCEIEIVIDELTPRVHVGRESFGVGHRRVALADDDIADRARIGAVSHGVDAVREVRRSDAGEVGAGRVQVRLREIVAGAIDRAVLDVRAVMVALISPVRGVREGREAGDRAVEQDICHRVLHRVLLRVNVMRHRG